MGIAGLLPLLKSIHKHCSLKAFIGQTIGIDAYGWLHRGSVACAIELALERPTTKYVEFAMSRVRMLQAFGITPYLVFDGDALPLKSGTNRERSIRRDEAKAIGLELYRAGKISQAYTQLQKAATVTPLMAKRFIEELKRNNVQYIVAPYEADAQLVYLEKKGIINGILSEDSDMLVYGAKQLITKLDQYGECVTINRADFASCKEVSLVGWTDDMFRCMAILSGCDYLPSISKVGLKTAYHYVRKYKDAEKSIRMIALEGKLTVPVDYFVRFEEAELTFLHHRVFCPVEKKMVHLHELPRWLKAEQMPYLGPYVDAETAIGVACGDLNAKTKEPIMLSAPSTTAALKENTVQHIPATSMLKPSKSIESFFAPKRQPLAELDPNSLTPSPSQQRLLERNQNASWTPRLASSAPQLRRSTTQAPSSTNGTDKRTFLVKASKISDYQAPKRQRLCSEVQDLSPSKEVRESPFFASVSQQQSPSLEKKLRNTKARKAEFDIFSDDSVDDVLLGLPDVQQVASPVDVSYPDLSRLDGEDAAVLPEGSILQSPPTKPASPRPEMNQDISVASPVPEDSGRDIEPFEDLLESHLRMQKQSLMQSFVYQSPSKREAALKTLSPTRLVERATTTPRTRPSQTQAAHAPLELGSAKTLPTPASVVDGITALESPPRNSQSGRATLGVLTSPVVSRITIGNADKYTKPDTSALAPQFRGSEDAVVASSEDEGSDFEDATDKAPFERVDLSAYVYAMSHDGKK